MDNLQDILNLLKPIGNATKRHEPGSCVIVYFYTDTSLPCARLANMVNNLPQQYPTLRIAAIDAVKFSSFNTEFGIFWLPTLMLFHQGRPAAKCSPEMKSYNAFITRHTGIEAIVSSNLERVDGPLPSIPVKRRNFVLWLAWIFIWAVLLYFFINSIFCKQIIEMIKRNWQEAQLEH